MMSTSDSWSKSRDVDSSFHNQDGPNEWQSATEILHARIRRAIHSSFLVDCLTADENSGRGQNNHLIQAIEFTML